MRTHRVMALAYLPLNGDFVVFLRLTTNSAYLNTYQRREKVEQRILKISWKFHENSRVFDGVMARVQNSPVFAKISNSSWFGAHYKNISNNINTNFVDMTLKHTYTSHYWQEILKNKRLTFFVDRFWRSLDLICLHKTF